MKEVKINFDLSPDLNLVDGVLTLTEDKVTAEYNSQKTEYLIKDLEEAVQYTDIGCGRLELKVKNGKADQSDNLPLCRFSMTCVTEIGEFTKVLNHLIKTGELTDISTKDLPICPKCHRHLFRNMSVCLYCVKKSYVFGRAVKYFKPYLIPMLLAGLALTFSNVLSAVMPLFNSILIDDYLVPTADSTPYFESRTTGIIVIALLMVGVFALSKVITVISTRATNKIGSRFSNDLRLMVYKKVQELSLTSMSKLTAGNLITRVTKDTERIKDFFNEQGRYLMEQIIMLTLVLVILITTNPLLTLLVVIPVPIALFMISRFWRSTHIRYHKQWRTNSKATSILHDIIKGIRVVKAFGNEEREIEKFAKVSKDLAAVSASNEKYWARTFPFVGNFIALSEFLVLIVGGKMVLDGDLSLGELTRFNLYLAYLYAPLRWISSFPRRLADASTSLIKIYEILDEEPQIVDAKEPKELNNAGAIEFKNVDFGYKSYEPVLKDINLKIEPGEMIGLVGHSGAGKSTLINLCMRLYDPTSGSITIDGIDLREFEQATLRDSIGVVFQETYLFSGSVFENIAYARPDASLDEVIAAAKAANAHEFVIKLPDGYNTTIGENGHTLSGGERQRISIARAILKNPQILILDEATSSLDPETEIKIQEALARLTKGRTTIAIAHRLATLRNADRLVVIEKGHIAECGPHEELMKLGGIYHDLVMAQRQTAKLKN
ncbi:MAG: ABC transporter ATP-binding protein [Ruminococcaceae bacterium]|nr:ABC transporter ATP-binding protein [Oscillospiraceae bacterium]